MEVDTKIMLETFKQKYISLQILWLTMIMPPYEFIPLVYCVFGCTAGFYMLLSVLQAIMMYEQWGNITVIFNLFYQYAGVGVLVAKTIAVNLKHKKIKRLCENIGNHWNIFTNKLEIETLEYNSKIIRKILYYYNIALINAVIIFVMAPSVPILLDILQPLNESRPRLYPLDIDFHIEDEVRYYPYLYISISIFIVVTLLNGNVADSLGVIAISHGYSLFSTIGRQLEDITMTKQVANKDMEKILYQECITYLKKYQIALKYVDEINSVFQELFFFLLLSYGGIITFVSIQILNVLDQISEAIRYIYVLVCTLIQFFVLCYAGQQLMNESEKIFYRAYNSQWYDASPRFKSLIMITLYRSFEPCSLTAGSMATISIETYGFVVQTAGSYFMTFLSLS